MLGLVAQRGTFTRPLHCCSPLLLATTICALLQSLSAPVLCNVLIMVGKHAAAAKVQGKVELDELEVMRVLHVYALKLKRWRIQTLLMSLRPLRKCILRLTMFMVNQTVP
jgi:hypothetical protein